MLIEQIKTLLQSNEEFCVELVKAENAEVAKDILNRYSVEASLEEVEEIFVEGRDNIIKYKEENQGKELSEEELDDVAGGGFWRGTLRLGASSAAAFGYGMACAVFPGLAAGAPVVVGGLTAWTAAGYMKK